MCCPPSTVAAGHLRPAPARADHPRDAGSPGPTPRRLAPPAPDTQALIADCDTRLARYQAALDAGADPQAVAEWTRQVKAERTAALARDASQNKHRPARQLTEDDIRAMITAWRPARHHPRRRATMKAAIYEQLGLKVTCLPDKTNSEQT